MTDELERWLELKLLHFARDMNLIGEEHYQAELNRLDPLPAETEPPAAAPTEGV